MPIVVYWTENDLGRRYATRFLEDNFEGLTAIPVGNRDEAIAAVREASSDFAFLCLDGVVKRLDPDEAARMTLKDVAAADAGLKYIEQQRIAKLRADLSPDPKGEFSGTVIAYDLTKNFPPEGPIPEAETVALERQLTTAVHRFVPGYEPTS